MDKYEYKLKLDQLKTLVADENYEAAADLADTINWKRVRNTNTLCMVADVYERQERYDACRDVLLQAYDHSPIGRNIVCRLTQVAIKAKDVAEAEDYYNEFVEIAPKDNMRYILAYQIGCLKGVPLTDRIAILEELKEKEYTELWAYELAALYSQADMRDKCVETCDELILWFGDGKYVERALDLKRKYQPLTPAQEKKYQSLHANQNTVEINIPSKPEAGAPASEEVAIPEITLTASKFNTMNLQEELAKSMQQIMNATERETVSDTMENIKKIVNDIPYLSGEHEEAAEPVYDQEKINEEVDQTIMEDFKERLDEKYEGGADEPQAEEPRLEYETGITDDSQMSIEDVLAEWEKYKQAAEEVISVAEQKKLEMAKQQALEEAGNIMNRLKTLIPILSATPGEDLPQEEDTVAAELTPVEPVVPEAAAEAETPVADDVLPMADEEAGAELPAADEAVEEEDANSVAATREMPNLAALRAARALKDKVSSIKAAIMEPADEIDDEEADAAEENPAATVPAQSGPEAAAPAAEAVDPRSPEEKAEDDNLQQILSASAHEYIGNEEAQAAASGSGIAAAAAEEPLPEVGLPQDLAAESAAGGRMTEEQRKLFSYFLPVPGMEEQITQVVLGATERRANSVTSLTGNILIQGEEGSGKTVLATSLVKAIQKQVGNENAKIGKISAESLNHRDFASVVPKIAGGYLIVDKAGELTYETAVRMSQVMGQNTQGMVVILEDTKAGIRKALGLDLNFAKKFTEKINIPIFTIDELVDFGKSYAREMECSIDEMGVLALYNRINNIQKLERATTLSEVKEIVDQAIESAEGGGIKKAFGAFFAKKYDENDYLILHEKDFEN